MADKLYPPYIEGNLPAFCGTMLRIPFRLNRAVGINQIQGLSVSIRTVQTNTLKTSKPLTTTVFYYNNNLKSYCADFDLKDTEFNYPRIGQYYKIQLAFIDKSNNVGYYSSVGVIKYTSEPLVIIEGLNSGVNYNQYEYVGKYSQEGKDTTEKVYTYEFNLYDDSNSIVATSGECIHNNSLDEYTYQSTDSWTLTKNLKDNYTYRLEYKVKTLNGLIAASQQYTIMSVDTIDLDEINAELHSVINNTDGSVKLWLQAINLDLPIKAGTYLLLRSSSEDNFESWHEISRDYYENCPQIINLWEDHTIQQGMTYIYALQGCNSNGLYSNKMYAVEGNIIADFEDAFLFDGERQLRIRYNPKIASFKTTLLESKMDTIGGKYPFVFKNGNVEYKEFSISGLISMLSDPNNKFKTGLYPIFQEQIDRDETPTEREIQDNEFGTQLTTNNMRKERQFKLEVLNWLNNGKPKLFRSPAEGNYIVRLMNCSLSPIDTLSRMLHTFNCNAYEIADYNFINLAKYGFIYVPDVEYRVMKFAQIDLASYSVGDIINLNQNAYLANFTQVIPGTQFNLSFMDGKGDENIEIGGTGNYYVEIVDRPLVAIELTEGNLVGTAARFIYGYYDKPIESNFSKIVNMTIKDEISEFIGTGNQNNIIEILEDIRKKTGKFYHIGVFPRDVTIIYPDGKGNFTYNEGVQNYIENWNPKTVYYNGITGEYYDGTPEKLLTSYDCVFRLNNTHYIDFSKGLSNPTTSGRYETIADVDHVSLLTIGTGLYTQILYQIKEFEYDIESTNDIVKAAKQIWESAVTNYEDKVNTGSDEDIETAKEVMEKAYADFINKLELALQEE